MRSIITAWLLRQLFLGSILPQRGIASIGLWAEHLARREACSGPPEKLSEKQPPRHEDTTIEHVVLVLSQRMSAWWLGALVVN